MGKDSHYDGVMGKAYDSKLMKRLLKYAKPYWKLLLLSLVLLVIITALELLSPYLVKIAIDEYINGNQKPMVELDVNSNLDGIEFNGYKYIRKDYLTESEQELFSNNLIKKILKSNNDYYLVDYDDEDGSNGIIIDKESYGKFRESDLKGIN